MYDNNSTNIHDPNPDTNNTNNKCNGSLSLSLLYTNNKINNTGSIAKKSKKPIAVISISSPTFILYISIARF